MRINEQGRSMIEMLGVLAIVGVLSVGGIAGYSKAMNKFKTNKLIDQINMLSTNIRTLYSSQRNYANLNNALAIQTGIVPSEMYDPSSSTSTTITNAFGGLVQIQSAAIASDNDGSYIIAVAGVPSASCISVLTTDWGGDSGSGLLGMYAAADSDVDTTAGKLSGTSLEASESLAVVGDTSFGLPYSVVNAHQACGSNKTVGIAWKYM